MLAIGVVFVFDHECAALFIYFEVVQVSAITLHMNTIDVGLLYADVKVMVSDQLDVIASGASSVVYRGNPAVTSNVSGGSTVEKD